MTGLDDGRTGDNLKVRVADYTSREQPCRRRRRLSTSWRLLSRQTDALQQLLEAGIRSKAGFERHGV